MIQFTVSVMNEAVSLLWNSKQKPGRYTVHRDTALAWGKWSGLTCTTNCTKTLNPKL